MDAGEGASDGRGGGTSTVVQVLQRHGIPAATAQTLEIAGNALRLRAHRAGIEWAAMFDIDTGAPVGGILAGGAEEVRIEPHLRLMRGSGRYVAMHTHLSSAAFSDDDAAALLANRPLRTLSVVGVDGTWYVLSKADGLPDLDPSTVSRLIRATVVALRGPYLPLVAAGTITADEGKRRILHRTWQLIAPRLGLRYDRVQGS